MMALIELLQLVAALTLVLGGLAFVAGLGGAARTLFRYGLALALLVFLLPTLWGAVAHGLARTREMLPSFPSERSALGWCTGSVVGVGHLSLGAWYLTRERRAQARRAALDEARRAHQRERERVPPSLDGGAS
jgi:uncharacterized membrane protein YiaA